MKNAKTKAPKYLRPETRRWFEHVLDEYALEPHHVRLLTLAAEAWDRGQRAREALNEHGEVFNNRFGDPIPRPEIKIENDSAIRYARLLRELALDVSAPDESRPPGIGGN